MDKGCSSMIKRLVESYLRESDWRVKENSNMSYALQGLNNYISGYVSARYWLEYIYPKEGARAHINGDIHIHNLSSLSVYCVGWDLLDLLLTGFKGVPGKITCSPARHLRSALGQLYNFMFTLQGETAGAIAVSNVDTLMAGFIAYEKLSEREVLQCIQEAIYNLNVPTRTGFQCPFTNWSLDLTVPHYMMNEPVIVGGKPTSLCYGDIQDSVDMFNKLLCRVMCQGDAIGRIFTFPILTYGITRDFEWDSEISEELFKMTAKYGIPYFSNFINSDMKPEDVRSMCCHLRLDKRELYKKGGGYFGANPLTGSIGVCTINMSRIGYLSRDEDEFFYRLEHLMEICRDVLETKREFIERMTEQGLYPYSRFYLRSVKARTGKYWSNHFSTIGLIAMNEACLNLLGTSIASKEGLKFSVKTLLFMREKLEEFQESTGNLYNLEATPAEGASYRLAKIDKSRYPDIHVANDIEVSKGASPFYTNSTNLPVGYDTDLFEALEHQNHLLPLYTGGSVFHVFLGESLPSWRATASLVRKIAENTRIPYYTITPTFSVCPNHGYLSGEHFNCPICNSSCEVYSRVVGYFRPVRQWNKGKQAEYEMRHVFKVE